MRLPLFFLLLSVVIALPAAPAAALSPLPPVPAPPVPAEASATVLDDEWPPSNPCRPHCDLL